MTDYIDKCQCRIHSLDGGMGEATILERTGDNKYLADYNGVKCSAIYNPFAGCYYVDDKYGVIRGQQNNNRDAR
jgi:hypothetical protein